jgi:hypothetical protein
VVKAPDAEVHLGQRISIPISVENVEDLYGFQISIEYDADIVRYESISSGDFLKEGGADTYCTEPTTSDGKISDYACTILGNAQGVTGSGDLLYIQFKGRAKGTTPITITDVKLVDSQENGVEASTDDGEIEVKTGIPPGKPHDKDEKRIEKIKKRIQRLFEKLRRLLKRIGLTEDEIDDIIPDMPDIPGSGQQPSQNNCGPADQNRDGVVSIQELRAYRELHKCGRVSDDEFEQAVQEWKEQEC